jgi:hypothetical protein
VGYQGETIVRLDVHSINGVTPDEKAFIMKVLNVQRKVISSQEFRLRFLQLKPTQTDASQQKIYDLILSGKSNWDRIIDNDIDYFITIYDSKNHNTIGFTRMESAKIFTNRWHLRKWMDSGAAGISNASGHFFHEQLHAIGFRHASRFWDRSYKRRSLPYLGGYLVRDLSLMHLNGMELTLVHA